MKQGPGYEEFSKYLDSNFPKGSRSLISQIIHGSLESTSTDPLEQVIRVSELATCESTNPIPVWIHERPNPVKEVNIHPSILSSVPKF